MIQKRFIKSRIPATGINLTALLCAAWLGSLSFSSTAQALPNCPSATHKIYCAVLTINKKINKQYAFKLSNLWYKYSKRYNTDPLRTVAIVAQESMFRNISKKHTVLELVTDQDGTEYMRTVRGYTDIGLYQFHAATIRLYGMDALRLRDDLEYATDRHMFLLREKLRLCKDLGDDAWTCYHSRTPEYRLKYKRMVNRYYKRISK